MYGKLIPNFKQNSTDSSINCRYTAAVPDIIDSSGDASFDILWST